MSFVKKYKFIIIGVLLSVSLLIGGTYAWINIEISGTKTNKIIAGTLSMELDESTCTAINIDNAIPISDEDGMKQVACTFTLENTGNLVSGYSLYLDDSELLAGETRMDNSDIKYSLVKNDVNTIGLFSSLSAHPDRVVDSGVLSVGGSNTYELRLWIDKDASNSAMGKVVATKLRVKAEVSTSTECFDIPSYGGEPNPPEMIGDMIPVSYDGVNWIKADINNTSESWYNYDEQMWANAVTVTEASRATYVSSEVGTVISLDDVYTFVVWIPRYSYTKKDDFGVQGCGGGTPSAETPGAFDVKFIDTSVTDLGSASYTGSTVDGWFTNSAFCWGNSCDDPTTRSNSENREVSGIWVSKYTIEYDGSITFSHPEYGGYYGLTGYLYDGIKNSMNGIIGENSYGLYGVDYDAHMIKNTESGAMIYLALSRYGKYGNTTYLLGDKEFKYSKSYEYSGMSTGNISGYYNSATLLMANLEDINGNFTMLDSGLISVPEAKYYNSYPNINISGNEKKFILGDATFELSQYYEYGGVYDYLFYGNYHWLLRSSDFSMHVHNGLYIDDIGHSAFFVITP